MKRTIMILAAIALVLGLPQCKKQTTGVLEGNVEISLDVSAHKGSRIDVNPDTGDVAFEQNDVVYVASGGKFVGILTCRGTEFKGQITNPTLGEPLYFFFLGNKTPVADLTAGTSTSCSVVISDQTSKLPVISFATSDQNFTGQGTYTAFFLNKAALVKFDVTTSSVAATCIKGMNNKVTVNFATNGFDYSQVDDGCVQLQAGSGERWAILLPQASGTHTVTAGLGGGISTTVEVPAIAENAYLTSGIDVFLGVVDLGLPSGLLWATYNVGANAPEGFGDYFAWGEVQPKNLYNWYYYKYCESDYSDDFTKYCNKPNLGYNGFTDNLTTLEPMDDAATANWGYGWRMPTKDEWMELINNTTMTSTELNGVSGKLYTAPNGNTLFLPSGGYYSGTTLNYANNYGEYWSSSLCANAPSSGLFITYNAKLSYVSEMSRCEGLTVRAVHDAN